jgi:4-amino-4-deoxy-L-arabinose transferase-like glycosyltransferase
VLAGAVHRGAFGVVLLAGAVLLSTAALIEAERSPPSPWPALAAWAAGIAALLGGARVLDPSRIRTRDALWPKPELLVVGVLTLLGLVVRVTALSDVPANFGGDEGEMGEAARAVLRGELDDPFTTAWLGHATMWFFAQALSLNVFGDDVGGLRALSALAGAATVPAVYWLGRQIHGPHVAILAAFLLAGYHFHVHFSRIALNNVADPLLVVVGFAAFLSGYRGRSPFRLALAGIALGLAQHTYYGARLAPLVVIVVLAHQVALDRRRVAAALPGLALAALGFVLAVGPLVRVPLFHWPQFQAGLLRQGLFQSGWFGDRVAEGTSGLQILFDQTWHSVAALFYLPVRGTFYEPGMPLLDPAAATLAACGLVLVFRRWRQPESVLIVAWLVGVVLFGSILLINPPQAHHYVALAPLLCLLVASGLHSVGDVAGYVLPRLRPIVPALTLAAAAALTTWSVLFYFRDYSPRRTYGWNSDLTEIAAYLASRPDEPFVYFFGHPHVYLNHGTFRFIAKPTGADVLEQFTGEQPLPPHPVGRRVVFLFLPHRAGEVEAVRQSYRPGVLRTFRAEPVGPVWFLVYEPDVVE